MKSKSAIRGSALLFVIVAAVACIIAVILTAQLRTRGRKAALPAATVIDKADKEKVVQGNTLFAFELYAQLKDEEGNLFFSPYSVSTALAMTYAGARGSTASQMADVLHFDLSQEAFHPAFSCIMQDLSASSEENAYQLNIANALWGQRGYRFAKDFIWLIEQSYGGGFYEVDFEAKTEEARQAINDWVDEKTQGKIQEIILPSGLDPSTRLVLTNAVYFKGYWMSQFKEANTEDMPFTLMSGAVADASLMYQHSEFKYAEDDTVRVLEMPYQGERLSMVVILPKETVGLKELEEKITAQNVNNWTAALRKEEVSVWIPKFKAVSRFNLEDILIRMGMSDAFSLPPADFSGMTGTRYFFISSVIHKAFVEVDETGTEAAAATVVGMELGGVPRIKTFKADHPFIFLIRDTRTGSVLFIGRLMDPRP